MRKSITVNTIPSYEVIIGESLANEFREKIIELKEGQAALAAIVDADFYAHYKTFFETYGESIPILQLKGCEEIKSLEYVEKCYDFLLDHQMGRTTILLVIGGGTIGDLGGFVAATFMRGIRYYQIPTTLMGMVDSAVGAKVGINLKQGKNLAGSFYCPEKVYCDLTFLRTLPQREFLSGFAEVIKYSLIYDKPFFEFLESLTYPFSSEAILKIVLRSCAIKSEIIQKDFYESSSINLRILLNFGHTFGHALEKVTDYKVYLHGEAVAIGMVLASRLCVILGSLKEEEYHRIKNYIQKIGLPTGIKEPVPIEPIIEAMRHDKKAISGKIRIVGLQSIGSGIVYSVVDEKLIKNVWQEFGAVL